MNGEPKRTELQDILQNANGKKSPKGESIEGEDLGECCARPASKWLAGLHVHNGGEPTRSFQFTQIDFEEFTPTRFTFIFVGMAHWKLEVHGRNLWQAFNYIHQHRLEWIKKADRDFGESDKPVITSIAITDVTPKE
jgi:hypothetical protein